MQQQQQLPCYVRAANELAKTGSNFGFGHGYGSHVLAGNWGIILVLHLGQVWGLRSEVCFACCHSLILRPWGEQPNCSYVWMLLPACCPCWCTAATPVVVVIVMMQVLFYGFDCNLLRNWNWIQLAGHRTDRRGPERSGAWLINCSPAIDILAINNKQFDSEFLSLA